MTEDQIFAKCARRLMPLIMAMYLINIFDRVNVGFAALTMNRDLGFSNHGGRKRGRKVVAFSGFAQQRTI